MSFDRLQQRIDEMGNPTVVGLDPAIEHIPPHILDKYIAEKGETLGAAAASVVEFNTRLIDALYDIVPAVKPQSAYYEALGPEGVEALKTTIDYAKSKGMYVICDGKRNDIGSTAQAYSAAYLGTVRIGSTEIKPFDADALTINAYLGSDGIKPFIETAVKFDKAVFALVKTSNPSAGELQDLQVRPVDSSVVIHSTRKGDALRAPLRMIEPSPDFSEPKPPLGIKETEPPPRDTIGLSSWRTVYAAVGDLIEGIARDTIGRYGFTRVGAVVGATYPEETELLRARLPNTFFLVPGYGAQGGSAQEAVRAFKRNGKGAIVNSSRAIIAAWKKTGGDYLDAARAEALRMRDELREALGDS